MVQEDTSNDVCVPMHLQNTPADLKCRYSETLLQVVEAQKNRILQMLLQGNTYGLPGSDGKVMLGKQQ